MSTRTIHRWTSQIFLATVVLAFLAALGLPEWLFYLPLAPLLVLAVTGTYLNIVTFRAGRRPRTVPPGRDRGTAEPRTTGRPRHRGGESHPNAEL